MPAAPVSASTVAALKKLYEEKSAAGEADGRDNSCPQYCDACFSGEYPVEPADMIEKGFKLKAAE